MTIPTPLGGGAWCSCVAGIFASSVRVSQGIHLRSTGHSQPITIAVEFEQTNQTRIYKKKKKADAALIKKKGGVKSSNCARSLQRDLYLRKRGQIIKIREYRVCLLHNRARRGSV